jgi:NCAIR mutase (PurE)-related protein
VSGPADVAPDAGLPFATLDLDRARRQGAAEVVFGEGKSPEQCVVIAERIAAAGHGVLLTRTSDAARMALRARFREARVHDVARTAWLAPVVPRPRLSGHACVVTAGTSDLPVADECLETLAFLGVPAERVADVGVAGVHACSRAPTSCAARARWWWWPGWMGHCRRWSEVSSPAR